MKLDKRRRRFLPCLNAGVSAPIFDEWINGVTEILVEEKIIQSTNPLDTFDKPFYVRTTGGRTDLVLPFKKRAKINISKLAMWRLRFGDASWISDYINNYAVQHGVDLEDEY